MRTWMLVAAVGLAGCPGATQGADAGADARPDVVLVDSGGSDAGASLDAGASSDVVESDTGASHDDVVSDAGSAIRCPESSPENASVCPEIGLVCTYGNDPRASCRSTATCERGGWQVLSPRCPALTCPSAQPTGNCADNGAVCTYSDTRCSCTNCGRGPCGGQAVWLCNPPPTDARCPRAMPNLGEACSATGVVCDYDGCLLGWQLRCSAQGRWVDEPALCPL